MPPRCCRHLAGSAFLRSLCRQDAGSILGFMESAYGFPEETTKHNFKLFADYHQFFIQDEKAKGPGSESAVDASGGLHAIFALAVAAGVTAVIFHIETTPQIHR